MEKPTAIRDQCGEVLGLGAHVSAEMVPMYEDMVQNLFAVLDVDCSESLGIDEFVEGLMRVTESSEI